MSEYDADMQQYRIREIMKETGLPFGPAVNAYIQEKVTLGLENPV
jgi:hypothetical protein